MEDPLVITGIVVVLALSAFVCICRCLSSEPLVNPELTFSRELVTPIV